MGKCYTRWVRTFQAHCARPLHHMAQPSLIWRLLLRGLVRCARQTERLTRVVKVSAQSMTARSQRKLCSTLGVAEVGIWYTRLVEIFQKHCVRPLHHMFHQAHAWRLLLRGLTRNGHVATETPARIQNTHLMHGPCVRMPIGAPKVYSVLRSKAPCRCGAAARLDSSCNSGGSKMQNSRDPRRGPDTNWAAFGAAWDRLTHHITFVRKNPRAVR